MKLFKHIELLINAGLFLLFALLFLFTGSYELLFAGCIVIGGLHSLSLLIHVTKGWFSNHYLRVSYYLILLLSSILLFTGIGSGLALFAAPFLALLYIFICYREFQILKFRELVHLK